MLRRTNTGLIGRKFRFDQAMVRATAAPLSIALSFHIYKRLGCCRAKGMTLLSEKLSPNRNNLAFTIGSNIMRIRHARQSDCRPINTLSYRAERMNRSLSKTLRIGQSLLRRVLGRESSQPSSSPTDLFPWYDSEWLSAYVKCKTQITNTHPEKLQHFVETLDVFKTPINFRATKVKALLTPLEIETAIILINDFTDENFEHHELDNFGRTVIHDHPFFVDIQKQITDKVSRLTGEAVEPHYNFLSLYRDMGSCEVHMDAPEAKWTVDVCLEQSNEWPIYISQIVPWPETLTNNESDWREQIKGDPKNHFEENILQPGENVLFSGSSQWHYRDPIPGEGKHDFCHLIFFHFIPKGTKHLVKTDNWPSLFGIQELEDVLKA